MHAGYGGWLRIGVASKQGEEAIFRGPDSWEFIRGPGLGKLAGGGPCIGSDPCGRAEAEAPTLHMPNYPTRKAETGEIAGDGKAYFSKLKEGVNHSHDFATLTSFLIVVSIVISFLPAIPTSRSLKVG